MKTKNKMCLAIPTYNREEALAETLGQVFALKPQPHEILVIDQTVKHGNQTEKFLRDAGKNKRFRLIHQQPPSLTAARNRALFETRCDIVVFIDDDVELPKDFIAKHLRNYENDRVAAVAGGVKQENPPRFPVPPAGGKWPRLLDYKYFSVFSRARVEGIATFMGCNHSARTETLRRLGGYDNNYIGQAFREDTDMAVRIWKSGGLIVFDPEAGLVHLADASGGCRIESLRKKIPEWQVSFNRLYFAFRHLFPTREFWRCILFRDPRETVLRKANVFRPWRIPWSLLTYCYSIFRAAFYAFRTATK